MSIYFRRFKIGYYAEYYKKLLQQSAFTLFLGVCVFCFSPFAIEAEQPTATIISLHGVVVIVDPQETLRAGTVGMILNEGDEIITDIEVTTPVHAEFQGLDNADSDK